MIPAQLTVVTLGARDLDRLRDFYRRLGWKTAVSLDDFAAFELRGALLCLFPVDKLAADGRVEPAAADPGIGFSLAINVDSPEQLDEVIDGAREAGARITKEPVAAEEFEGRSAYFADPEDNYWEVVYVAGGVALEMIRRATGQA